MLKFDIWNLWLIVLITIDQSIAEINLSPTTFWDQTGTTTAGLANGTAGSSLSQLNSPSGISITSNDVLYISDAFNYRIVAVQLGSITSTSIIGNVSGASMLPSGVFATNTSLYVTDLYNNLVKKMSLNGSNSMTVPGFTGLNKPYDLYVDNNDNIYLSDTYNSRVLLFLSNSTNSTMVAGTGVSGSNNTELNQPFGVFVNIIGIIYIADHQNHRIMKWFPGASTGILVAGDGTAGNSSTQLYFPTQIIVDTNEYMYISDSGNARIMRWAPNSTFGECIVACTGIVGNAATQLGFPFSLTFDSNGSLYVSDVNNNRVQKFQILNDQDEPTTSQYLLTSTINIVERSTTDILSTATSTFTLSTSLMTVSYQTDTTALIHASSFVPSTCANSTNIGPNCNISGTLCDLLQPCQNNGTCQNNDTIRHGYFCSCPFGFDGTHCQFDHRSCQSNTCWDNGECIETSNTTFICLCERGWEGSHCETTVNYCHNVTCQNNGVCRPLFLNYTCDCLDDSYSGRHCEITANRIVVYRMISISVASIAILVMVGAALYFIIMDILKYVFGIDPVDAELKKDRKKKQARKRKPVIQRFVYVNAPPLPRPSEQTTSTVKQIVAQNKHKI